MSLVPKFVFAVHPGRPSVFLAARWGSTTFRRGRSKTHTHTHAKKKKKKNFWGVHVLYCFCSGPAVVHFSSAGVSLVPRFCCCPHQTLNPVSRSVSFVVPPWAPQPSSEPGAKTKQESTFSESPGCFFCKGPAGLFRRVAMRQPGCFCSCCGSFCFCPVLLVPRNFVAVRYGRPEVSFLVVPLWLPAGGAKKTKTPFRGSGKIKPPFRESGVSSFGCGPFRLSLLPCRWPLENCLLSFMGVQKISWVELSVLLVLLFCLACCVSCTSFLRVVQSV